MVRTLHVIDKELPSSKARQTLRLTRALRELSCESVVCSLSTNEVERTRLGELFGSERVVFCPQHSRFDPTFLARFGRVVREQKPDVIHYCGSPNLPLWIASQFNGTLPLIANLTSELSVAKFGWKLLHKRWNSTSIRIVSDYRTSWSNVVVAPGISPPLSCVPEGTKSLREELNVGEDAKLLAVKSDLLKTNDGKDLIWGLDCLRVLHPDCLLVFFGEGRDEAELRDYAERASTDSNVVRFIPPSIKADIWLEQCDCFWNADSHSNLNSILEAMRCGLPVVAADVPESRSVIVDGETGFLVPQRDSAEFARRTNILFQDPLLAESVRDSASSRIESSHRIDQMARNYFAVYQEQIQLRSIKTAANRVA